MILNLIDSQHVLVYQVNFWELLIMSNLHTVPIFPKCTNIGAVFWPTVSGVGSMGNECNWQIEVGLEVGVICEEDGGLDCVAKCDGTFMIKTVTWPAGTGLPGTCEWEWHYSTSPIASWGGLKDLNCSLGWRWVVIWNRLHDRAPVVTLSIPVMWKMQSAFFCGRSKQAAKSSKWL